ncbi:hypothetical protein SCHPADRAFT_1002583 [Schizopora paradoxa]|uniref:Uncharacterized protein n=1 Tax=Schizopora paradoxa TaxID=27342 RepID=A0A0H2R958_9AGAM|nr:hypothetical protein SCHPADRAFT_1002583 [Schizopora paradoxa]
MNIISDTLAGRVSSDLENARLCTAPITSLIPDVLSQIFEHVCSTPASISLDEIAVSALDLSRVCRSWRSLALSQPSLWSSLSWGRKDENMYADTRWYPAADKRHVQLWQLYLSRSRQAALDISLFLYKQDDVKLREHLLDYVFKEQHRLQGLRLYCRETTVPYGKKYILNDAPRLKILKILVTSCNLIRPPVRLDESITVDTSRLSKLQILTLCGNVFILNEMGVFDSLQFVRFWPNKIDVGDSSMSHELALPLSSSVLLSFLHCVPHIQELSFIIDLATTLPITPPRLVLRHLNMLILDMNTRGSEILDSLLGNLYIPAMETLILRFYGDSSSGDRRWRWNTGAVLESVRSLILEWRRPEGEMPDLIHDENLRSLLQCTPALKSLDINAEWISPQTLSLLTLAHEPSENVVNNLCPKLEALSLLNVNRIVSYQNIVDLISSRFLRTQGGLENPKFPGLKDVFIRLRVVENENDAEGPELEDIEPICSFIKEGLQLNAMCF